MVRLEPCSYFNWFLQTSLLASLMETPAKLRFKRYKDRTGHKSRFVAAWRLEWDFESAFGCFFSGHWHAISNDTCPPYAHTPTHMHTPAHPQAHVHTHAHTHAHTHVHMHKCTHTNTHTYIHMQTTLQYQQQNQLVIYTSKIYTSKICVRKSAWMIRVCMNFTIHVCK